MSSSLIQTLRFAAREAVNASLPHLGINLALGSHRFIELRVFDPRADQVIKIMVNDFAIRCSDCTSQRLECDIVERFALALRPIAQCTVHLDGDRANCVSNWLSRLHGYIGACSGGKSSRHAL